MKNGISKWVKIIVICFFIILSLILYTRFIGIKDINIKEINIINNNLPKSFYGYKIAHISDIHYNTTVFKEDLDKAINILNKSKPDIVVITGDILDKETNYKEKDKKDLIALLNKIECKYKYAITGDHDNNKIFDEIIDKSGFKSLDNTYEIIYNGDYDPILIGGISTRNDKLDINEKIKNINLAIEEYKTTYNILLIHEPSLSEQISNENYQLILAGHTHNGQINIPGIKKLLTPVKDNKYTKIYYKLTESDLYISPGIGTSNIKGRFLNKPTINLYRLLDK